MIGAGSPRSAERTAVGYSARSDSSKSPANSDAIGMALRVERGDTRPVRDAVDGPLRYVQRGAERVHVGDRVVAQVVVAPRAQPLGADTGLATRLQQVGVLERLAAQNARIAGS